MFKHHRGGSFFARSFTVYIVESALFAHVKWTLQVPFKSIPVSWFTRKRVDYCFVLFVSTRSIFYLPYSVNVTATNELWEVYKVLRHYVL